MLLQRSATQFPPNGSSNFIAVLTLVEWLAAASNHSNNMGPCTSVPVMKLRFHTLPSVRYTSIFSHPCLNINTWHLTFTIFLTLIHGVTTTLPPFPTTKTTQNMIEYNHNSSSNGRTQALYQTYLSFLSTPPHPSNRYNHAVPSVTTKLS